MSTHSPARILRQTLTQGGVFLLLVTYAHSAMADVVSPTRYPNPMGDNVNTIPDFLALVLEGLSLILMPLVIIYIIYAGFLFVTAQGEEGKIEKARHALLWTIVGVGVILGAQIMANILRDTLEQLN